jgi:RNA polymerase sigma-70 factor (ECF subfamily)
MQQNSCKKEGAMKQFVGISLMGILFAGIAAAQPAEEVSVKAMPPVVVKTVPESGRTDVDPKLSEITVTFSKEMMDKAWSWAQISDESFPTMIAKPRYLEDKRTCAAKVKLEPGRTYVIWLNSEQFQNFRDADGRSAVPYLLVFETRK